MDAIETLEHAGLTIKVYQDPDAESPREWDNVARFAFDHRRYNLPWEVDNDLRGLSLQELYDELCKRGAVIILKVYGYDHGIFTISAESFYGRAQHAAWDSGIVGLACVFRDDILREHNRKRLSKKLLELADNILRAEIKEYDQFLTGDVYGYVVEDEEENNLDSCWGYFGLDYAISEAKSAAECVSKTVFDPAI